jgi:hypothetical protein
MEIIDKTEPTPMTIPSIVSVVLSLFEKIATMPASIPSLILIEKHP